jgi:hypothetical protein
VQVMMMMPWHHHLSLASLRIGDSGGSGTDDAGASWQWQQGQQWCFVTVSYPILADI